MLRGSLSSNALLRFDVCRLGLFRVFVFSFWVRGLEFLCYGVHNFRVLPDFSFSFSTCLERTQTCCQDAKANETGQCISLWLWPQQVDVLTGIGLPCLVLSKWLPAKRSRV